MNMIDALGEFIDSLKDLAGEIARAVDMLCQIVGSCDDAENAAWKRIEQLRVSKAGWSNSIHLSIIHDAKSVETVPVASYERKVTSATGK